MSLVSTNWLNRNYSKVKIIDATWHMPNINRNANEEYKIEHLKNAIFFDLDNSSDRETDLPHMLPSKKYWEKIISKLGIHNDDNIVIYDNSDVISSCRCWYNFIFFNHNPKLVHVLDGGLKKWKLENKKTTNILTSLKKTNYIANINNHLVKNKLEINRNVNSKEFIVVDARSKGRFQGTEPEPRKNTRSGSIPNSICLPYKEFINDDGTFINKEKIKKKFASISKNNKKNLVFSCGSGVTASVLALAYSLINITYMPIIYDGSWAEYGKI